MTVSDDLDLMTTRTANAWRAVLWAVGVLVLALVIRGLLISPSIGIADVHLPASMRVPVAVEPLGKGIGAIPRAISAMLELGSLAAGAALIWALVRRRATIAKLCLALVLAKALIGPIPVLNPSPPPSGVDLPTAERLVGPVALTTMADNAWKRYVVAQVAYLRGDRGTARRLSQGLDAGDLGSWREAAYRISLLQGREPQTTNVCLIYGCLPPHLLAQARTATLAIAVAAALWTAAAGALWFLLRARLARIDVLRSRMQAREVPA